MNNVRLHFQLFVGNVVNFGHVGKFGFGNSFCGWIKVLYANVKGAVITDGIMSRIKGVIGSGREY